MMRREAKNMFGRKQLAWAALLLFISSWYLEQARCQMAEPTLITPVYDQLQAARDGSVDDDESERAVRLARDSGRAEYVSLLLEIAQKRGTGGKRSDVAFEALHAADALADIRMELLAFARNHHNEPWLARCAILILAREYEKETYQLLKSIYDESQVNFVRNAAVEAHTIKSLETRLRAHERPADQIALVLRCFLCDWNTFTLGDKELHGKQFPRAVWTQRRLRELSTEHPKLAAEAVLMDSKYRNRSEVLSRSYREFLSKFLGDDSRTEFGRLMETQKEGLPTIKGTEK